MKVIWICPTVVAITTPAFLTSVSAQPGQLSPPMPVPQPAPAAPRAAPVPQPAPAAPRAAPVPQPNPARATEQDQQMMSEANRLMETKNYREAASLFQHISTTTVDPEIRGEARAMQRIASNRISAPPQDNGTANSFSSKAEQDSGRAEFVITTTGAAFYSSFAVVDILGIESFKPVVATVATTTGMGLALSLFATQDKHIDTATAKAYTMGLGLGLTNGLLLASPLGISVDGADGDGEINQNYLLFGLATMAAGGTAATFLSTKEHLSEGQVSAISMAGISGFSTAALLMTFNGSKNNLSNDTISLLLAGGLDLGLGVGNMLARDIDWSPARSSYIALSQIVGALGGFAVGALAIDTSGDSDTLRKTLAATTLVGLWAGFGVGKYATRNMSPDVSFQHLSRLSVAPMMGQGSRGITLGGRF